MPQVLAYIRHICTKPGTRPCPLATHSVLANCAAKRNWRHPVVPFCSHTLLDLNPPKVRPDRKGSVSIHRGSTKMAEPPTADGSEVLK